MAIRPVDLQITVPKTAEYSKQFQGEIDKQNLDQQVFAQVAAKHAELKQTMVIETNESNESENSVNKDGRNKQEQRQGKRKKHEEEKEKDKNSASTGLFDIRV